MTTNSIKAGDVRFESCIVNGEHRIIRHEAVRVVVTDRDRHVVTVAGATVPVIDWNNLFGHTASQAALLTANTLKHKIAAVAEELAHLEAMLAMVEGGAS